MRDSLEDEINENYNLLTEELNESGEVIALGTFQSTESVYIKMIAGSSFETFIVPSEYPVIDEWYQDKLAPFVVEAIKANPELIGTAIDTRFNITVLNKRKLRVGKTNYALHYMLDPRLTDELKFPLKLKDLIVTNIDDVDNPIRVTYSSEQKINRLKHRGFHSDYYTKEAWSSEERAPFIFTILAVDPSGRGSDETGYAIVSIMGGKLYYRAFGGLKGGYEDDSLNELVGLAQQYKVNAAVVESNFGDGAYLAMLSTKLDDANYNCELVEVRASTQKESRIIDTLEPLMNQHRIIVDITALEKDFERKTHYSLSYQLSHIQRKKDALKGAHDDVIDTWELAAGYLVEYMARGEKSSMNQHEDDKQDALIKLIEEGFFPHKNTRSRMSSKNW